MTSETKAGSPVGNSPGTCSTRACLPASYFMLSPYSSTCYLFGRTSWAGDRNLRAFDRSSYNPLSPFLRSSAKKFNGSLDDHSPPALEQNMLFHRWATACTQGCVLWDMSDLRYFRMENIGDLEVVCRNWNGDSDRGRMHFPAALVDWIHISIGHWSDPTLLSPKRSRENQRFRGLLKGVLDTGC